MKDIHDVIKGPVLTEKSYDQIPEKKYTFSVDTRANKTEIKQAVEEIFEVKVAKITTTRKEGKLKRQGRTEGRTPAVKQATVTLTKDSKAIEFFEGMIQ